VAATTLLQDQQYQQSSCKSRNLPYQMEEGNGEQEEQSKQKEDI